MAVTITIVDAGTGHAVDVTAQLVGGIMKVDIATNPPGLNCDFLFYNKDAVKAAMSDAARTTHNHLKIADEFLCA